MNTSTRDKVLSALQAHNLKQVGANQWRSNSPLRPGSDSHSFTLVCDDDEHGAYKDFVSDDAGSLYDLAKHLGIETATSIASTKRPYDGIDDYARAHGITADILMSAGWSPDTKQSRRALKFVTQSGHRWRFLDDQKPHYISVNGYKKCWYGFNETCLSRLSAGADLVITNGEISTVVGHAYGFAAVAVTSGEGRVPADLLLTLKEQMKPYPNTKLVVALDCDDKGRKSSDAVVKQLKSSGFNVVAVDLKLSKGGDFADWLALYGLQESKRAQQDFKRLPLIETFDYTPTRRWEIVHARELANRPMIKWLIKDEIPDKALTAIYGASGVGKSFVTLDYALRIAQHGNVVYIAGEGETGYYGRIKAWCQHHGQNEGGLFMCLGAVSLLDAGDMETFVYEVEQIVRRPTLIVVDTLARSMLGGDENSSRDMGQFVERCDMLRQRFQCAVIVVHHTNKTGIWERGSGALRGAVEMMLRITDEDELIVIECAKSKNDKGFEAIYRRLQQVDIGLVDEDGNAVMPAVAVLTERTSTEDLSGLTRNQRLVLETVCEVFEGGFTIIELNDTLSHIDRGTLYRVVSKLRKLGYIDQPAKRDPYEITPAGFAAVGANVANVANVAVVHKYSDTQESDSENKKYNRDNRHNRDKQHVSTVFGDRNSYYDEGM